MITIVGKYYLYRHIRLDKNEVFYVGIGTKRKNFEYYRAYEKQLRSSFWNKIISKTEYIVEIVLESDNYDFIKQKEIEFISLYGRRDLNCGKLCNLTNGGDGKFGFKMSEETKKKIALATSSRTGDKHYRTGKHLSDLHKKAISNATIGKKKSPFSLETRNKMSVSKKGKYKEGNSVSAKKVIDTSTNIIYESVRTASICFNINYGTLKSYLSNKRTNKTTLIYLN